MSDVLAAAVAGLLQGFLEWLPVSSSGQVFLYYAGILGVDPAAAYAAGLALHLGTALSALTVYRAEYAAALRNPRGPLARLIAASTAAAAPVGYGLMKVTAGALEGLEAAAGALVGAALLATAAVLVMKPRGGLRGIDDGTLGDWVALGLAEGVAAVPGLSRSGLTIAVLLLRGFSPPEAVRASFIAAVPVTLAAGVVSTLDSPLDPGAALAGLASSYIAGLAGLRAMQGLAERLGERGVAVFAAAVGAIALALSLPALLG